MILAVIFDFLKKSAQKLKNKDFLYNDNLLDFLIQNLSIKAFREQFDYHTNGFYLYSYQIRRLNYKELPVKGYKDCNQLIAYHIRLQVLTFCLGMADMIHKFIFILVYANKINKNFHKFLEFPSIDITSDLYYNINYILEETFKIQVYVPCIQMVIISNSQQIQIYQCRAIQNKITFNQGTFSKKFEILKLIQVFVKIQTEFCIISQFFFAINHFKMNAFKLKQETKNN
ncbi:hypothetical protein pb186bvf_002034 [Paramecium bursaria]